MTSAVLALEKMEPVPFGEIKVTERIFEDGGTIPNSPLPLIVYKRVLDELDFPAELAAWFEQTFAAHQWGKSWRNGIYTYYHYHSTAHEVLAVYSGSAMVTFGGLGGKNFDLEVGDVVIIPAGVGHRSLKASADFGVVGAYPEGQDWDILIGERGERPAADRRIARVPLPRYDPIYGVHGCLPNSWKQVVHQE
jgi:uncharacterized protein YjlB